MPVIKSAIKKLKQDKKREAQNDKMRNALKSSIRAAKKTKSSKAVTKAVSTVDKAAKLKIIHPNKAARYKSSLSKLAKPVSSKTAAKTTTSPKKESVKKKSPTTKKGSK